MSTAAASRHSLAWDHATPESLVRVGIRRAESSLSAIRVGQWHFGIIAVFVVMLWILQALGLINAARFLLFYTAVCTVIAVTAWSWMMWRERHLRNERAVLARLLAALEVSA